MCICLSTADTENFHLHPNSTVRPILLPWQRNKMSLTRQILELPVKEKLPENFLSRVSREIVRTLELAPRNSYVTSADSQQDGVRSNTNTRELPAIARVIFSVIAVDAVTTDMATIALTILRVQRKTPSELGHTESNVAIRRAFMQFRSEFYASTRRGVSRARQPKGQSSMVLRSIRRCQKVD